VQAAGYAIQLEEQGYGNADGTDWKFLEEKIEHLFVIPFGAKTFIAERSNVDGMKRMFEIAIPIYGGLQAFKKRKKFGSK
jgi:hypothetical protein